MYDKYMKGILKKNVNNEDDINNYEYLETLTKHRRL